MFGELLEQNIPHALLFVYFVNHLTDRFVLNCPHSLIEQSELEVIARLLRSLAGRLSLMLPARRTNEILPLLVAIISVGGYILFLSDYGQSAYAFLEGHLLRLVPSILLCLDGLCRHHLSLLSLHQFF